MLDADCWIIGLLSMIPTFTQRMLSSLIITLLFLLFDIRLIYRPKNERAIIILLLRISTPIPQTHTHMSTYIEVHIFRRIPPPTQDNASTRQNNAFICPQVILLDLVEIVHEVLHERDALPAHDAVLFRQRIQPADGVKIVVQVDAGARELDVVCRWVCLGLAALGCDLWLGCVAQRVQTGFEDLGPAEFWALYEVELEGLHVVREGVCRD
jgi:hypothetical protein